MPTTDATTPTRHAPHGHTPGFPPPAEPGHPGAVADPSAYADPSQYNDPGYGSDPDLDAFAQIDGSMEPVDPAALGAHHVTAVMVAHNGERWLERSLAALSQLDRPPERIVAVDTGSRDGTSDLLEAALGAHSVTRQRKATGFGDAVAAGVGYADHVTTVPSWQNVTEWIWILHDDCAPEPDALRRLLESAVRRPDAAVIGPKVRSWGEERQLLEVGLTITSGGRRHTGLEKREYDQGQHDVVRDVLAVGSAGMLIRRDVWDELKGFDRHIAVFRDDIDFGWRANLAGHKVIVSPAAIVTHAEAAAHGRRRLGASRARVHLVDRRNALYVMLVNAPARRWLLVLLRLTVSAAGRAFAFLIGKQPALAFEEIGALLAVALRPDRIIGARIARSRLRKVRDDELRHLFPPAGQQIRHTAESLFGVITGTGSGHDLPSSRRHVAAETGPSEDEEPLEADSALLEWFARPPVLLVGSLVLLALVAARSVLGGGRLHGGALFAAPDSAGDLWATYTSAWHGIGLGTDAAVQPYIAIIAGLSSVIPSPSLVVDLLLLGSVPLSALTAYLMARRLVGSQLLRVWVAGAYGLLPATTGAISAGRLGTAVAAIVTPLVALAAMRTLGVAGAARSGDRRAKLGPFRAAWSAGLLLAIVIAFVPVALPAAAVLAVVGAATVFRSGPAIARLLAMLVVAPIVLVPWTFDVLDSPGLLLTEAGAPGPGLSDPALEPWSLLLGQPGGPGGAPVWLFAGVLVVAFIALMRSETLRPITAAWAVVVTGLAIGLFMSRQAVSGPTLESPVAGWPGYPAVLVDGGLIVAAMYAAAGIRNRLRTSSFGWRQPLAVALVMIGGATPVVAAGWWVWHGSDTPLDRGDPMLVPAYAADESARDNRVRTLVLDQHEDGRITYGLVRESGPALGTAELGSGVVQTGPAGGGTGAGETAGTPPPQTGSALELMVSDLVSGRGGADAGGLADFAAQYVYLPPPADPALTEILDTVSGLRRASAPDGGAMWRFDGDAARVRVVGGPDGDLAVPSGPVDASGTIPPGPAGRTVVVSEHADSGWSATLEGRLLPPVVHEEWAQAFTLPESGGELVVTYDTEQRHRWLWIQLGAITIAFVLALPGMRRAGAVDDVAEVGTDEIPAQEPVKPAAPPAPPAPEPQPVPAPVYEHTGTPEYAYSQPSGGSYPSAPYAPSAHPDQFPPPGRHRPTGNLDRAGSHHAGVDGGVEEPAGTGRADAADEYPGDAPRRRDASRHSSGKAGKGGKGGKRAKGRRRPKDGER